MRRTERPLDMKLPTYLILASTLAAVGCTVPNGSSIRFLNAHEFTTGPQTAGCTPQTINIYRGSLDLAGSTRYIAAFDWESVLAQINTVVSPDTLAGPQRNEWVLDHLVFNYSSTPSLAFQAEQISGYAVQPPGASGSSNWIGLSLLAPQARQTLLDHVQVGASYEVLVTFQAFGALASGQKIATNKVTYPIVVYRSGFTGCVAPDIQAPTGPCGDPGGQDGTEVGCCRAINPVPQGCPTR